MSHLLDILGVGLFLPPAREVRDLVRAAGGDPDVHDGWRRACVGGPEDHPSTMGAAALAAALAEAHVAADELDLVLAVGVSRDYPASWSTATEIMRLAGASDHCFGFDLTVGCLGALVGLQTALGWLRTMGGGRAAIVTAERWSQTVDRRDSSLQPLWGHADGGGAIVVGLDRPGRPLATFHGAAFTNHKAFNGMVLQQYGGTRHPVPPPGECQHRRVLTVAGRDIWPAYHAGYSRAVAGLREQLAFEPHRLVCNQISPKLVRMIGDVCGVGEDRTTCSGHDHGHVGSADVVIGLRRILDDQHFDGPVTIAASAPYAFGAGLIAPPGHAVARARAARAGA